MPWFPGSCLQRFGSMYWCPSSATAKLLGQVMIVSSRKSAISSLFRRANRCLLPWVHPTPLSWQGLFRVAFCFGASSHSEHSDSAQHFWHLIHQFRVTMSYMSRLPRPEQRRHIWKIFVQYLYKSDVSRTAVLNCTCTIRLNNYALVCSYQNMHHGVVYGVSMHTLDLWIQPDLCGVGVKSGICDTQWFFFQNQVIYFLDTLSL